MGKKSNKRRIGTIDLDTGEIIENGIIVHCGGKVRWPEDWGMFIQEGMEKLAKDRSFTGEMWRVWAFLMSKLGFENWIVLPQSEIAKELGMQKQHVSRAINKFLDRGMLLKGPKMGRTFAYKLNSRYAWKGSLPNLSKDRLSVVKDFYSEASKRGFQEVSKTISKER